MKDLTQGSIRGHIVAMATPIAVGMLVQTLYFLVDLYFVSRIGAHAVAGVSAGGNAGGNAVMLTMALTQVLSVGSVALISHAVGAKDPPRANLVFNQSLGMAVACTLLTAAVGLGGIGPYMRTLGAGDAIAGAGRDYLMWYLPGLALQFPLAAMGSAMRGTGIAMPGMVVQMLTVLVNIVLAPVLIAGTPAGQLHEIGAALVAAAACNQGWRVVYLGPSLPAEEIASAALQNGARVVALSIVHPADDPHLPDELHRLRERLPDSVAVVAGGRSAAGYRQALANIRATLCESLADFTSALDLLRQGVN